MRRNFSVVPIFPNVTGKPHVVYPKFWNFIPENFCSIRLLTRNLGEGAEGSVPTNITEAPQAYQLQQRIAVLFLILGVRTRSSGDLLVPDFALISATRHFSSMEVRVSESTFTELFSAYFIRTACASSRRP